MWDEAKFRRRIWLSAAAPICLLLFCALVFVLYAIITLILGNPLPVRSDDMKFSLLALVALPILLLVMRGIAKLVWSITDRR